MSTIDPKCLCPGCMAVLDEPDLPCPLCDFDKTTYAPSPRSLRPFTILNNKYLVGKVIGEGGFGITYIGFNMETELPVAIKEYFPSELGTRDITAGNALSVFAGESQQLYKEGLEKYLREARNLTMFSDLPGIVTVKDFFYENETAYIIMEFINGITLKQHLMKVGGRMSQSEVTKMMKPVLESMIKIHETGMIHRDISPDNIMITKNNSIKLTDFGAARVCNGEDNKSITVVLKRGYAPEEQYRVKGAQGPWTDVYALCATMYKMITGNTPQEALERMIEDNVEPLTNFDKDIWPEINYSIMKGLSIRAQDRFQNVAELVEALYYSVVETDEQGNQRLVSTRQGATEQTVQPVEADEEFGSQPIVVNVGHSVAQQVQPQVAPVTPILQPVASAPAAPQPLVQQPVASAPAAPQPLVQQPVDSTPAAPQPLVQQPVDSTPAAPQPLVQQPVASAPAAPQPLVQQPVASAPAAPQPLVQQPLVSAPAAPQPLTNEIKTAAKSQASQKKAGGFFKSTFKKVVKLKLGKVRFEDDIVELNVEHNDVGSIQPLRECYQLQKLILSNNMVDDLSPLVDCSKLAYLALRNTRVEDLQPLSGLSELAHLDLWGTRIRTLEPLYGLKNLTYLNVKNTEITKSQIDDFKAAVPGCQVEN